MDKVIEVRDRSTFVPAIIIAVAFGTLAGALSARTEGIYTIMITLAIAVAFFNFTLQNWSIFNGFNGFTSIPAPVAFGVNWKAPVPLYYLILFLSVGAMLFVRRIRALPLGRAFEALREDETASVSLGLNPTTIKLSAFALGASIAGLAGAFFAARQGFVSPESFTFSETAIILSIVVLGGMGSPVGIIIAAIFLVGLPEWFRGLAEYRMLAFGAAMVLIMVFRPRGLSERAPTIRTKPA